MSQTSGKQEGNALPSAVVTARFHRAGVRTSNQHLQATRIPRTIDHTSSTLQLFHGEHAGENSKLSLPARVSLLPCKFFMFLVTPSVIMGRAET